eukprot:jgi/Botrbrau1/21212/Bobra.39_2s0013.1
MSLFKNLFAGVLMPIWATCTQVSLSRVELSSTFLSLDIQSVLEGWGFRNVTPP